MKRSLKPIAKYDGERLFITQQWGQKVLRQKRYQIRRITTAGDKNYNVHFVSHSRVVNISNRTLFNFILYNRNTIEIVMRSYCVAIVKRFIMPGVRRSGDRC